MTPFRLRLAVPLICALGALALAAPAFAGDLLKIAAGQRGKWDGAVVPLGGKAGIFRKHGVDLEVIWTAGGGETMQAVISGSVDIGLSAGTQGVFGVFSKGAPVRIISAQATGDDAFWYVSADSKIQSFTELAGKTVAYSTNGSSTHASVLALIDHFKVAAKPTATGGPPTTFTSVMSGQIDAGWSAPPFGIDAINKKQIRVIATSNDLATVKNHTIRVNIANANSLASKPDVYKRFMAAYRETWHWMYSTDEALATYAEFADVSVDVARRIRTDFDRKDMVNPDEIMGLDDLLAEAVKFKYIAEPLSADQLKQLILIPR